MQANKEVIKVIPSWLTKRFNSSSARVTKLLDRDKRSHPYDSYNYNYTHLSKEEFYGVYFENSSVKSLETFVYKPVEKVFGSNVESNVVKNSFKRMENETHELERPNVASLVRVAHGSSNMGLLKSFLQPIFTFKT